MSFRSITVEELLPMVMESNNDVLASDVKTERIPTDGDEKEERNRDPSGLDVEPAPSDAIILSTGRTTQLQKTVLFATLGIVSFVLFLDNSTTTTYLQYAASQFNGFSVYATLSTTSVVVCLVIQTPLTKLSDVVGLGVPFSACILFLTVGFTMMAASKSMDVLSGGLIFSSIGAFGILVLGQLTMSHHTSARARTLGISVFYLPNVVTPFISSEVAQRVLTNLSWRWGFGIFSVLYTTFGLCLVGTLFYTERRGAVSPAGRQPRIACSELFSQMDLVGNLLIISGFGLTLLPITLAGTGLASFQTPYIIALLVVGMLSLFGLAAWERCWATHPILPSHFFRNKTIVLASSIGLLDYFASNISHTYLYSWAVVARNMDISQATLLLFTQNVVSVATMVLVGLVVFRVRRYKWFVFGGCVVRTVGYGVMTRLRGADNTVGEIFTVQVIQGIGTGIMEALLIPAVQLVAERSEMGQVTGVLQLFRFTGTAIAITVAGAIYNNLFQPALRSHMPPGSDDSHVAQVYNSLLGSAVADWGTPERDAISDAYGDVMRYMVIGAAAVSAPMLLFCYLLPNLTLSDSHACAEQPVQDGEKNGSEE